MAVKMTVSEARARGRAAGEDASRNELWLLMAESGMKWARMSYPASADLDYKHELVKLEKERMAADLDLTRFPECRGLREVVEAEHKGFHEACNSDWMTAFHFNWFWFISRRLNTRYVARSAPRGRCTAVWFSHGEEGPLQGNNLDDIRRPFEKRILKPPKEGPSGEPIKKPTCVGGVSAAVLCDEEPHDIFPVNVHEIMPDDIDTVEELVKFLERYREFFGPGNQIWVDSRLKSVALEKSNCRMGVRYERNGASAITALSYLTPEMNAFKKERDRISVAARGWDPEDNPDTLVWAGAEQRYHRLLRLVDEEARRGPTLWGVANIMLDPHAPFPERISVAGERCHPAEPDVNWTLMSSSSVLFGPTRRMLTWILEGDRPIFESKPYLTLGKGVKMREEWKRGTRLENS
jgi:hypothetical protein